MRVMMNLVPRRIRVALAYAVGFCIGQWIGFSANFAVGYDRGQNGLPWDEQAEAMSFWLTKRRLKKAEGLFIRIDSFFQLT